jgi:hypothetical protein
MPWRHLGGILALDGVSGQCHALVALAPGKGPLVPIVQEAGWAPEPVWTQRLEEKSFASAGDCTPIAQSSSLQSDTVLTELPRLVPVYSSSTKHNLVTYTVEFSPNSTVCIISRHKKDQSQFWYTVYQCFSTFLVPWTPPNLSDATNPFPS